MKNIFIFFCLIGPSLFFASCSKSDSPSPALAPGTFILDGYTFKQSVGQLSSSSGNLYGGASYVIYNGNYNVLAIGGATTDKKLAILYITFQGSNPPAAGNYEIYTDTTGKAFAANQVLIGAFDSVSVSRNLIVNSTTGLNSVKNNATVTVSSAGKITVNVPTIKMYGQNVDQTNPKNTKFTYTTSSLSGSFFQQ